MKEDARHSDPDVYKVRMSRSAYLIFRIYGVRTVRKHMHRRPSATLEHHCWSHEDTPVLLKRNIRWVVRKRNTRDRCKRTTGSLWQKTLADVTIDIKLVSPSYRIWIVCRPGDNTYEGRCTCCTYMNIAANRKVPIWTLHTMSIHARPVHTQDTKKNTHTHA